MLKGHLNFHTIKEDQFKNDMFLLEHYPSVSHHFLIAAAIADLYSNPLIGHSQAYEGCLRLTSRHIVWVCVTGHVPMSWEHGGEAIFSHKMVTLVTCHWPQPWYLEQSCHLS